MKLVAPLLLGEQVVTPVVASGGTALYSKTDGHLYSLGDTGSESRHPPVSVSASAPITPKTGDLWVATGVGPAQAVGNFAVGTGNPLLQGPGVWVETGLGLGGGDFTMWIEDGT